VSELRPIALLRTGDQWVRCSHDSTFLDLFDGIVELAWTTTTASSHADAPAVGAGLAFDGHCRLVHSLPEAGRVERVLWTAIDLAAPADTQPAPVDLFEAPVAQTLGDFQMPSPATPLIEPRGLAVDADERLFVAEAGADRILVYNLWDERLVQHIALPAGSRPTDLAAQGLRVLAVLAGSGRIVSLSARGALQPFPLPEGCDGPSRVAISPGGHVAVLARAGGATAHVGFVDTGYADFDAPKATDIEWESDTVLVVAQQPGVDFLRLQVEAGRSDRLPSLRARAYDGLGIVAVPPLGDAGRRIGYWTARGLRVAVAARLVYATRGRLTTYRLDSGAYQTEWGRVFIDACIPEGASLHMHAIALDEADDQPAMPRVPPANVTQVTVRRPDLSPPMPPVPALPGQAGVIKPLHRRESGRELPWTEPAADDPFVTYEAPVIAPPGRYLWLTLELRGNTRVSPKIRCLRAEHPTHDYLRRLPRTFSRDNTAAAFLQRYLAMFEGFLGDLEVRAVDRDLLLDPRDTPPTMLPWLAGFVGLVLDDRWASAPSPNGQAPADVRRQYIEEAVWLFRYRGTLPGLKRFIEIYTGIPVVIIEHYRLRGLGAAVLGDTATAQASSVIGFGMRVGGAVASEVAMPVSGSVADAFRSHAHRFTVVIPAALSAAQLDVVRHIVDVHRPAHTLFELCSVDAGMHVGLGLLLELTSVIGRSAGFSTLQLGASTIGRGSLIGRPRAGARIGSAELGRSVTVG
jgi:phage tail-like protein